jgi:hypothetical protein
LRAYREAVARLKSVMERVGVDPEKDKEKEKEKDKGKDKEGSNKRGMMGRSEEEGRTLRGIVSVAEFLSPPAQPHDSGICVSLVGYWRVGHRFDYETSLRLCFTKAGALEQRVISSETRQTRTLH